MTTDPGPPTRTGARASLRSSSEHAPDGEFFPPQILKVHVDGATPTPTRSG